MVVVLLAQRYLAEEVPRMSGDHHTVWPTVCWWLAVEVDAIKFFVEEAAPDILLGKQLRPAPQAEVSVVCPVPRQPEEQRELLVCVRASPPRAH